jgi:hypothetical protein
MQVDPPDVGQQLVQRCLCHPNCARALLEQREAQHKAELQGEATNSIRSNSRCLRRVAQLWPSLNSVLWLARHSCGS